jgi:hypothetical protein
MIKFSPPKLFGRNLKQKIGEEEIEIENELHEWLREFWENHEREREEISESETVFEKLERIEKEVEEISTKVKEGKPETSKEYLKKLFKEIDNIEKFVRKLEKDVAIKIKYEKKLFKLTDTIYNHIDKQRKEIERLYNKV